MMFSQAENAGMHDSVRHLLARAIEATKGGSDPVREVGDLMRHMSISSAVLTNWKKRGISRDGAIKASSVFGIAPDELRPDTPEVQGVGHAAIQRRQSVATRFSSDKPYIA